MADKYTEVAPEDVIWSNLGLNPYEMRIRKVISYALTAALIILWAIPVAFVGIVSNVYGLCVQYHWLAWLCKLPSVVVGLLQGILPAVLLAVLMMLLPIILRLLANFEGIPRRTGLELSLMTRYFIFQVIVRPLPPVFVIPLTGLLAFVPYRHHLRWSHPSSPRYHQEPELGPHAPCTEPPRGVDVLPHLHRPPRPHGHGGWDPPNRPFDYLLRQARPSRVHPQEYLQDQVYPEERCLGHSFPCRQ